MSQILREDVDANSRPLDAELRFFRTNRRSLWEHHPGKFALIKGERLIATFDTAEAAYTQGVTRFGSEDFLIRQITEADVAATAPALYAGLLTAFSA